MNIKEVTKKLEEEESQIINVSFDLNKNKENHILKNKLMNLQKQKEVLQNEN